jgi:hypothetical protein
MDYDYLGLDMSTLTYNIFNSYFLVGLAKNYPQLKEKTKIG